MDPLRWAKFFASVAHTYRHPGGPQLYGGLPYAFHLAAVAAVLERFGSHGAGWAHQLNGVDPMLAAAWLHDVVEDTDVKLKEVGEMFGAEVMRLVGAVTNEPGPNRKARGAATYPKIRQAGKFAVRLKLADRIANVEHGGNMVEKYREEYEDFRRALRTPWENADLWEHLDGLLGYREPRPDDRLEVDGVTAADVEAIGALGDAS